MTDRGDIWKRTWGTPYEGPYQMKKLPDVLPSAAQAMKVLDQLEAEIARAPSFEALNKTSNMAAAMQRAFRPMEMGQAVADRAGEVWIEAEVGLGTQLDRAPVAKGTRGLGRPKLGGAVIAPPNDVPTYAEMGFPGDAGKKRAARAKKLATIPRPKRKRLIAVLKKEGRGVSPNALAVAIRKENKTTKKHEVATAEFSADGPFGVAVIDPPWPMQKIDRDDSPTENVIDYPVMTIAEIIAHWKDEIAPRMADDCHVFMWTTQKYLPAAIEMMPELGLNYVLVMVWHKPGGFQPFDLPQYNCEFAVYARKGAPVFIDLKDFFCCFEAPRREHSRKPDEFYDTIRRVTGGSRIDIFSREARDGFAQYGNQPAKFSKKP